nr:ScyD/ScyE family protein [Chloroflexia bacterium]
LFGYPISQAEMETNAAGDTVLTQWFERARFEFHPDNPEGQQVLLGLLGVEVLAAGQPEPGVTLTVVAENLAFPLHASLGGDGAIYVAEAGTDVDECVVVGEGEEEFEFCFGLSGAITRIAGGESEQVVTGLPGPADVVVTAEGEMYAVFGFFGPPEIRDMFESEDVAALGTLAKIEEDGSWTIIADLAAYEGDVNPDPTMVDSNPYSLIMDGENFIVVDAGGNSLLQVTPEGEITTLAVFPPRMVLAPPFLELPEGTEIPMDSVPTTVAKGPDGAYYVGELTGFPFPVDAANVWRVVPGEDPEVYATGFSAIGAIDFDSEGNLYVLEIASGGLLEAEMAGPDNPDAAASAVIKVSADGSTQEVWLDEGIFFATGLAIDADDIAYIVNLSVTPGAQVVRVDWPAAE